MRKISVLVERLGRPGWRGQNLQVVFEQSLCRRHPRAQPKGMRLENDRALIAVDGFVLDRDHHADVSLHWTRPAQESAEIRLKKSDRF
jgi:hypothetical protein